MSHMYLPPDEGKHGVPTSPQTRVLLTWPLPGLHHQEHHLAQGPHCVAFMLLLPFSVSPQTAETPGEE